MYKIIYCTCFFLLLIPAVGQNLDIKEQALLDLVAEDVEVRKLADGFRFTEGPVWNKEGGYLLFSDIPANKIYKWSPGGQVSVFREPSNNSNGLTFDAEGNLLIAEHSGRKIGQLSPEGEYRAVVESYEGTRFNSPNDVIIDSKGIIYFTDPPYGLPNDAADTLGFNGVYQYRDGKLTLISRELDRPNGLALSPDERTLYVANSGSPKKYMKFPVSKKGKVGKSELFYDVSGIDKPGNPDGIKVDTAGHLYATGPGGVWVFSADGKHLGTITFPETPANIAFGGPDMKTLFVTARTGLYAVELKVSGK